MPDCSGVRRLDTEVLACKEMKDVFSFLAPGFGRHVTGLKDCNGNTVAEGSILCFQELTGIVLFGGYREPGQT